MFPLLGQTKRNMGSDHPANMGLYGRWLHFIWITWSVLVVLILSLFVISLLNYSAYLHALNVNATGGVGFQLTPNEIHQLQASDLSLDFYIWYFVILNIIFAIACLAVGGILFWRKHNERMALFVSAFLVLFVFNNGVMLKVLPHPWDILHRLVVSFLNPSCVGLVACLFPTGQFLPPWSRWIAIGTALFWGTVAFTSFMPHVLYIVLLPSWIGSLLVVQIYRHQRLSSVVEQQQTKWVVFGSVIAGVGYSVVDELSFLFLKGGPPGGMMYMALLSFFLLLVPLSIGIAVLRYRLWDIDVLIHRATVYVILTASVGGIYLFIVVALGTLFHARDNPLLALSATALIAVLFQPLRHRLQHAASRLVYGERDDPYVVISRLGKRLEATIAPDAIFFSIAETVAQALKLPYVAITLQDGSEKSLATSYGTAKGELVRLPLLYQTEQMGEFLLAPRSPGESFTRADYRLLSDLARQVSVAAYAVRLTQDLQQARERLISAREEERRRLRRDLHDGLGPLLSSQTLLLTSAQMLLRQAPDEVEAILQSAITQSQEAIHDIRRLVYALRPPALDDLGLIAAIQEQIVQKRASGIAFSFSAPEQLPPLPAAVEVACYRIVQEALTNVLHHARAHTCSVLLTCREQIIIEISDDGLGLPSAYHSGVGLTSMRERAEELGGNCCIEAQSGGGTRVQAQIPYQSLQA
ncbi:MAG TPA: sensor histidine kinase [Ktedonobacteraceae bacterium]|nr:sensor histidine kinase [Ktedonobacteraceae bacterium]